MKGRCLPMIPTESAKWLIFWRERAIQPCERNLCDSFEGF